MPARASVRWIDGLAACSLGMQAMQAMQASGVQQSDTTLLNQANNLTLSGALIVAVGVLWRALAKKDDAVLTATKTVTEALITASNSNRELRKVIEESVRANKEINSSIDELRASLAALPCILAGKADK
jgi:hypothetical protein